MPLPECVLIARNVSTALLVSQTRLEVISPSVGQPLRASRQFGLVRHREEDMVLEFTAGMSAGLGIDPIDRALR